VTALRIVTAPTTSQATCQRQMVNSGLPQAQKLMATGKPNVLSIIADGVGWLGVVRATAGSWAAGHPNIDRIIVDNAVLIDGYALTSCTAERAAFSTGHMPLRTGLTTVGVPASRRAPGPEAWTKTPGSRPRPSAGAG
jgi:arylsulfatase A-like enzyme